MLHCISTLLVPLTFIKFEKPNMMIWANSLVLTRYRAVSSNHLNIRSVWKSMVTAVCVTEVWTRVFNAFTSSTKCTSPVRNVFFSGIKSVHIQHNNVFVFYLEVSLEPRKRTETRDKAWDERTQEDYPTSAVSEQECKVFLRQFEAITADS